MVELVIDASVVVKWYMADESLSDEARSILDQYLAGDVDLLAPTILPYEVLNALFTAEKMHRIAGHVTEKAFLGFLELEIKLFDTSDLYSETVAFARSYHRSIYDASYLAMAKRRGIDFVTGDMRLFNAVQKDLKWVKRLGDYKAMR